MSRVLPMAPLLILAVATPLIYALAAIVGVGLGLLLLSLVKEAEERNDPKPRAEDAAKLAARRAVDETLRGIGVRDRAR